MSFTPYLFFVGTCREAMNTYQSIFGGQLDIVTAADMPDAPEDAPADAVMHAALTLPNGGMLFASDDPSATEDGPKTGISVSYTATDPRRRRPGLRGAVQGRRGAAADGRDVVVTRLRHVRRPLRRPVDGGHQPDGVALHLFLAWWPLVSGEGTRSRSDRRTGR